MDKWNRKSDYLTAVLLIILMELQGAGAALSEEIRPVPVLNSQSISNEAKPAVIHFDTYQRNIDSMFQLALMAGDRSEFGLNSMIIEVNRKIAEDPGNAEHLMSLGHIYRILGQPAEANRFYEKALAMDPENFHLNVFSAVTLAQKEKFEEALMKLDQAVKINPLDEYAWMTRGKILVLLQRNEEAKANLEKVLSIHPDNRQAVFALSLIYQLLGDHGKAVDLLEKLRSEFPDDPAILYHTGAAHLAQGNAGKAVEYWEGLFAEGIRDVQFLFQLAAAYLESGNGVKAQKILEPLNFFFPRELDVEFLLAESYRQINSWNEADRRYRLILAEDPNYVSAALSLAQILELQGKKKESRNVLKKVSRNGL